MKKILSIIIMLALLLSPVPAMAQDEPATDGLMTEGEVILIDNDDGDAAMEQLKQALRSEGDCTIRLMCSPITSLGADDLYSGTWAVVGKGVKTLDLNGHKAELNAYDQGGLVTMIGILNGAELRIVDTSGSSDGGLWIYGRIDHPCRDGRYFQNKHVKHRDVFHVAGGTLRIYAGTFEAGRSKQIYIADGLEIDAYGSDEFGVHEALGIFGDFITHYNGDAWMQINGNCISQYGGQVFIYGGTFLGRGYQSFKTELDERIKLQSRWERGAAVNYQAGEMVIAPAEGKHPRRVCTGLPEDSVPIDFLWYDVTAKEYLTQDDQFEAGHAYRALLTLADAGELAATVNGRKADFADGVLSYTFPVLSAKYAMNAERNAEKVDCSVSGEGKFSAWVLLAWYDGEGRLVGLEPRTVSEDDPAWMLKAGMWKLDLPAADVVSGAGGYSAFLVDGSLTPLVKQVSEP